MSVTAASVDESGVIRTPDQRLRVFVSSTLGELAPERAAAKLAIERLHLAPVMFELGARPHPPRALYRAYVQQSHIFMGIYWESYGWIAPGMDVSGIEDEYALAAGLPCLVYVKDPAPGREPKLEEFLARVQREDRVSYKRFSTPEQLAEVVADDVALLLTEHFEAGEQALLGAVVTALRPRPLPIPPTRLVGREQELEAICGLVGREDVRLVTLSGVGGIGKTRLALAAAAALHQQFADGVGFVDLSSVQSPELVPGAVAAALGVPQEGTRPVAEQLLERLPAARVLLVLDNFEHLLAAGSFVSRLLAACPQVKVLVTSRALLRLRGEHEFPVSPLEAPHVRGPVAANGALSAAAVRLFVERAREHEPQFTVEANRESVVELCWRLEGIPLAIELAAARIRVLPPDALLGRIEDRLDLLSGPSDLPERQQTLRATIDWSYDLLSRHEQELFAALSVFVGGFTLESAQAVCHGDADVLEGVSSLIERSLIVAQERPGVDPRFRMLETVREYARERLEQTGEADATKRRMVEYLAQLADQAGVGLTGVEHNQWLSRLDAEVDNMRAAITWALDRSEPELFLRLAARPWIYWWQRGYVPEMRPLLERCLESYPSLQPESRVMQLFMVGSSRCITGEIDAALPLIRELIELERERGDEHGLAVAQWLYCSHGPAEPVPARRAKLAEAASTLCRLGDKWVASFALGVLGSLALVDGDPDAAERLGEEALEYARAIGSESAAGVALCQLGYIALARRDVSLARERFADGARAYQRAQDREGLTYALEGLAAVALAHGKAELAAQASGVVDATREQIGIRVYPLVEQMFRGPFVAALQTALGTEQPEAAKTVGAEADLDAATEELLSGTT